MEDFELVQLHNGLVSLRCLSPRETFHPAVGPAAEAKILHVEQQRIVERASELEHFEVWDVGLGAAANVLIAIEALSQELPEHPSITIQSFDKTTSPLRFALKNAKELGYLSGHEESVSQLLDEGKVRIGKNLTWNLHGEFTESLRCDSHRAPDAIFYDPYSAKGNPEMWSLDTFSQVFQKLDPARLCLLSNYTASTYIRVTLLLSGFYVGRGCAVDKKVQTTIASNRFEALKEPLDLEWLKGRVTVSHSAAPIREIPHTIAPLVESDYAALLRHPQFQHYL